MTRPFNDYEAEIQRFVDAAARHRRRIENGNVAAKQLVEEIRSDSSDIRRRVQELTGTANGWRRTLDMPSMARREQGQPVRYRQRDIQHRKARDQLSQLDRVRTVASDLAGEAIRAKERRMRSAEATRRAREAAEEARLDVQRERGAVGNLRRLLIAAALSAIVSLGSVTAVHAFGGDLLEVLGAPFALGVLVGYSTSTRLRSDIAARLAAVGVLLGLLLVLRLSTAERIGILLALIAVVVASVVGLHEITQYDAVKKPAPAWSLLGRRKP